MSGDGPDKAGQLAGGWQTSVWRDGEMVLRSSSPWSASVVALLRHLSEVGFAGSPTPVGSGFDADGNETLTFIPGESPHPHPWNDDAMHHLGVMVAELHEAGRSFEPPADARWQEWFGRTLGGAGIDHLNRGRSGPVMGHGDLGPWNIMAVDGRPTGFIDWDTAGPIDPVWELAQVGWLNAQLHDDDIAERLGLPDGATRAGQLCTLLDGYQLAEADRVGFVDKMVEFAVHAARSEAIDHSVNPDTTTGVGQDGYPFAWGMAWRIRGASWMLRNRRMLERAIGQ